MLRNHKLWRQEKGGGRNQIGRLFNASKFGSDNGFRKTKYRDTTWSATSKSHSQNTVVCTWAMFRTITLNSSLHLVQGTKSPITMRQGADNYWIHRNPAITTPSLSMAYEGWSFNSRGKTKILGSTTSNGIKKHFVMFARFSEKKMQESAVIKDSVLWFIHRSRNGNAHWRPSNPSA